MIVQLQKDNIPKATEKWKKSMILYVGHTEPTIASLERFIAFQWNLHEWSLRLRPLYYEPKIVKQYVCSLRLHDEVLKTILLWIQFTPELHYDH